MHIKLICDIYIFFDRMSLNNLKDLRDRVLFLVSRTRKPKVQ